MDSSISNATSDTATGANPTPGTAGAAAENIQAQGGEASGQGATAANNFIPTDVDLNTLPPQVRAYVEEVNKQMVRGFTQKTEKISETVKTEVGKAVEAYKQKASFYDAFVQEQELVKLYNDYLKQRDGGAQAQDPTAEVKAKLSDIEMKLKTAEAQQYIDAFVNAADAKGNKINALFDELNSSPIGEVTRADGTKEVYTMLRAAVELAPGNTPQEKLANGYKAATAEYNRIFEAGKKAGMGRVQAKAANGTFAPSSTNAGSQAPRRPKDGLEALRFAQQGLAVFNG